ncbi:MAG TPA: molybdopterin cofactor-binding domain-containing protein [Burkholderiales bacterium]
MSIGSDASVSPGATGWTGQPFERREDAALLTGTGRFADDLGVRPGTLHAAFVRSPHAHARARAIDVSAALAVPGVRTVLTGEDIRRWAAPFVVGVKAPMEHWCLAVDKVRYAGEPVALVVAGNRYLAEDAADLVRVDYEPLPVAVEIAQAVAEGAALLHEAVGSNVVSDRSFVYGDPDRAFAAATHRVRLDVRYPRNSCTPIECFVAVAEHLAGGEGYDVLSNFMGPFSLQAVMALALKVPSSKLRLRSPRDSGGSFGVKQAIFPYVVALCLASRKAGAPVKWVEDRLEHLSAATSATGRASSVEAAVDAHGRILALDYDQIDDVGGYLRAPEPATFYRMHGCLTGAYDIPSLRVRNRVVVTNKTPAGLVRGFGGPQVYFALERVVHEIARRLQLDPLDVFRRNFIPRAAFPYRAAAGALIDSGDYHGALELAVRDGALEELRTRRAQARAQGRLYGIGFAAIVEPSISNMGYITTVLTPEARARAGAKNGAIATATVSIDLLGGVAVTVASVPQGQGHATVLSQVVADVFGLHPDDIAVNVELDTQKDAWSVASGNYSSRFAGAVAGTAHLAAMRLRHRVAAIAAAQLNCAPADVVFAGGKLHSRAAPDRALHFARVASGPHWAPALLPEGQVPGLRETAFWTPEQLAAPDAQDRINTSAAYGFAFDICALEIDRATGSVRIDRYVTAHDAGRLLNPALADGQIRGGFAQALGAALMEDFAYSTDGAFLSGTFADYLVPTAAEVPEPMILHIETPSPFTPLGAKGLGEGNSMSTPVCIANALADALGPEVAAEAIALPMTPSKILALIGMADPPPAKPPTAASAQAPKSGGRALAMSGAVELKAPPQAVFDVLLDPAALAAVIPGCHALSAIGEHRYSADVTLGIGPVRARYRAEVALSEIVAPRTLRLAGCGTGALGSAEGSGRVTLSPAGSGTRLEYEYEVSVGGKVAAVGGRMLEGAARIVLGQLFERLDRRALLGTDAAPAESAWKRWLHRLGITQ